MESVDEEPVVKLKNVSFYGDVDLPTLRLSVKAGEVVEVPVSVAVTLSDRHFEAVGAASRKAIDKAKKVSTSDDAA
jgi:hypothetical protein